MGDILKFILKKFFIFLTLFILISVLFLWSNNLLMSKLNASIEEREHILTFINEQTKKNKEKEKIKQKIKEIEDRYKINFYELKKEVLSVTNISDEEIKNKILLLGKELNLNIKENEASEIPHVLDFSLIGGFDDLKKFENMLINNKIKAKINSVKIFKQNENYLFQIELLVL